MPLKAPEISKIVLAVVATVVTGTVSGQTFDTEYYPDNRADDEFSPVVDEFSPIVDEGVFVMPAWTAPDPFLEFSRYRFGHVRYLYRGLEARRQPVLVGGVDLSDNLSGWPDWTLISLVRRAGMKDDVLDIGESPPDDLYVSLRTADVLSRAAADVRHSQKWTKKGCEGLSHALSLTGRVGPDGHIKGLFANEAGGTARLVKDWNGGASLSVFASGGHSRRGARTAATAEAFELTGDPLYNPTWGWQGGAGDGSGRARIRNSRINRAEYFFAAATFEAPLGGKPKADGGSYNDYGAKPNADLVFRATAAFRHSRRGRTRLAWFDAGSPMPDYYRKMPSALPDGNSQEVVEDAWSARGPAVVQIDWNSLYFSNLGNGGQAHYIVEEQVERANDLHFRAEIEQNPTPWLKFVYGVGFWRDRSRFFKVADDLLGASWVPNVDQYVVDNQEDSEIAAGASNENDLKNPGRQVRQGERFGYDYAMTRSGPSAFASIDWHKDGYGIAAEFELSHTTLRREGFYEKALFPGAESFGRSRALKFVSLAVSAAGWWNVSPRHGLSLRATAATEPPVVADAFLSPAQNNLTVSGLRPSEYYIAEVSWAFTGRNVDLRVSGFLNSTRRETDVRAYYDDISRAFSEMVVRDIGRLNFGVEVGLAARPVRWLTLKAGVSAGRFRYSSDPTATVFVDATGDVTSSGIVCYMRGLRSGVPEIAAAAGIEYSDHRHWRASVSCEWLGRRYVEINPLFHSSRVAGITSAPEIAAIFATQQRLPDAFTVGVSLSKGFVISRGRRGGSGYLLVSASVDNLLNTTIIHSGYEQMRIRRTGTGLAQTLVPFLPKFLYSRPLTWNIKVSYRL